MGEDTYKLIVGTTVVAQHVSLKYACIFLEAIMHEFYADEDIRVSIEREPQPARCEVLEE